MRLRSGKAIASLSKVSYKRRRIMNKVASIHYKARSETYPSSTKRRAYVPDDKVLWTVEYPEYAPENYTAPAVEKGPIWADPDISSKTPKINFNKHDGLVNRISFTGEYKIVENLPRNPVGRTGLTGRGLLGKWGPNHAADPIVTRWSHDKDGNIIKDQSTRLPILQFVAVLRKDNGEWAIPGGMVDAGEKVSLTLKREFGEEAMNSLKYSDEDRKSLEKAISKLFTAGEDIYKGYVDDPRNTDNAWMETVAVNFHDDDGTSVSRLPLEAGDDAGSVRWMNVSSSLKLYASHSKFLQETAKKRGAHW